MKVQARGRRHGHCTTVTGHNIIEIINDGRSRDYGAQCLSADEPLKKRSLVNKKLEGRTALLAARFPRR